MEAQQLLTYLTLLQFSYHCPAVPADVSDSHDAIPPFSLHYDPKRGILADTHPINKLDLALA
ncbi:hypothetical protein GCM10023310_57140 [Paenibacillus vulneris]